VRREKGNETQSEDDSIGKLFKKREKEKQIVSALASAFAHAFLCFLFSWSLPLGITTD
jgi:hypothetical protein